MAIRYQQQNRTRIDRVGFFSATNIGQGPYDAGREKYWWSKDHGEWLPLDDPRPRPDGISSHVYGIRSKRAFRRRLKQWSKYLPKGTPFVLVSRWRGYNIYGKTT